MVAGEIIHVVWLLVVAGGGGGGGGEIVVVDAVVRFVVVLTAFIIEVHAFMVGPLVFLVVVTIQSLVP